MSGGIGSGGIGSGGMNESNTKKLRTAQCNGAADAWHERNINAGTWAYGDAFNLVLIKRSRRKGGLEISR